MFFAGVVFLAWGLVRLGQAPRQPARDVLLDGGRACPAAPVRILEPAGSAPAAGSVVVFHGLSANRLIMLPLGEQFAAAGFRVYLVDSPGHGVNPAPFSFAANEACAAGLLERLEHTGEITRGKTVLLGHSMGGGLVLRLADYFPAAGTISLSGAPIVRPHRLPENLLLIAPQFDIPDILVQERELSAAAGPERDSREDFRQARAFRLLRFPWQTHTSPIFSAPATRAMVRWALESVGATTRPVPPMDYRPFRGALLGLAGILLMFPAALEVFARLAGLAAPTDGSRAAHPVAALLAWLAAGIFSAMVLVFWMPLARIHLFGGDYLGSFLLVAGLPLALAFAGNTARGALRPSASVTAMLMSTILALATAAAIGAWSNWQLAELWPSAARLARLPLLAGAMLPASFAEEAALGPAPPLFTVKQAGRPILALALRGMLLLGMLGAFESGVGAALLPVIFTLPLAGLSFGVRLGMDLVRRRTSSAAAAALFGAILNAWFVAAAFPLA